MSKMPTPYHSEIRVILQKVPHRDMPAGSNPPLAGHGEMSYFEEWYMSEKGKCLYVDYTNITEWLKAAYEAGRQSVGHCSCTMAQKLTGDGCAVCNPTMKREIECYNEGVKETHAELVRQLNINSKLGSELTEALRKLAEAEKELNTLKSAVYEYLERPSTDGKPIRQEMRANLKTLISPQR